MLGPDRMDRVCAALVFALGCTSPHAHRDPPRVMTACRTDARIGARITPFLMQPLGDSFPPRGMAQRIHDGSGGPRVARADAGSRPRRNTSAPGHRMPRRGEP
jgi:hypothetical protein